MTTAVINDYEEFPLAIRYGMIQSLYQEEEICTIVQCTLSLIVLYKTCTVFFTNAQGTRYDYNLPIIQSPKLALNTLGTSWSVLLINVSYHKVYNDVWFMGGDLNSFQDIRPIMK